ncbi:hypothetical protein ACLKA6_012452 [Drosophila palustris]
MPLDRLEALAGGIKSGAGVTGVAASLRRGVDASASMIRDEDVNKTEQRWPLTELHRNIASVFILKT